MSKQWSPQQSAIFGWFKQGSGNLVVRARAGTGKTTTILEGISHAPEKNILLVAFNKSIATELQSKLKNPYAEAKTLHSLGFSFITKNWTGIRVDAERSKRLASLVCGSACPDSVVGVVRKLASLAKNICPDLNPRCVSDVAVDYDCIPDSDFEQEGWTLGTVVNLAIKACELALQKDGSIDFDDMLFVPVRHGWVRARWDLVVVDEAQDMNATQLILASKACKGRLVVVGDDRQAIYGFRGADSNAIDRLKLELAATELGLTTTYRCPSKIVAYAKTLVPDYEAAPNAPEGTISGLDYSKLHEAAMPGDFVLSRKNAPLAGACLALLRAGKPAKISGKDIAKTLLTLVNKWKGDGIPRFLEKLTKWEEREFARAAKLPEHKRESRQQFISDQAETVRALSEGCTGVSELRKRIENMFVDESSNPLGVVLCSSIHKAKGQERERVFLFGETLYIGGRKAANIEEANLEYVGVTRAKRELVWVSNIK